MDEAFTIVKIDDLKKSPEYLLRRKALLDSNKPKVKRLPQWLTAIRSRLGFK